MRKEPRDYVRMIVRESLMRETVFDDVVQNIKQRLGGKYSGDLNTGIISRLSDPGALLKLRDEDIEYVLNPLTDSWFGRLGTTFGYDINFHKLLDQKNNYRAAISPDFVTVSVGFFKSLMQYYDIRRVITLNSDGGGQEIPALVMTAGLESVYVPIEEGSQPTREQFEKIVNALISGNSLIHCTNGADRTGAIVARYYVEELGMNPGTALADAELHGFRAELAALQDFVKGVSPKKDDEISKSQRSSLAPLTLPKSDSSRQSSTADSGFSSTTSYDNSERKQIARSIFKPSSSGGYHLISSEQCTRIRQIPERLQAFLNSKGLTDVRITSNGTTRSLQKSLVGSSRRLKGTLHGSGLAHDLKIYTPETGVYDGEKTNKLILFKKPELVKLLDEFGEREDLRWGGFFQIGKTKNKIDGKTYYAAELHHYEIKGKDHVSCLSPGLKAYMDLIGMSHNEISDTESRVKLYEKLLKDIES